MPDFDPGGIGVDVSPDFTGFQQQLERGLAKAVAVADVNVSVGLDLDRAAVTQLRRQLVAQTKGLTVPVGLDLDKAALRKLRADMRAMGPVAVSVSLAVTKTEVKQLAAQIKQAGPVTVPVQFDAKQVARSLKQVMKTVGAEAGVVTVRVDVNAADLASDVAAAVRSVETSAPDVTVGINLDPTGLSAATAAAGAGASKSLGSNIAAGLSEAVKTAATNPGAASAAGAVSGAAYRKGFVRSIARIPTDAALILARTTVNTTVARAGSGVGQLFGKAISDGFTGSDLGATISSGLSSLTRQASNEANRFISDNFLKGRSIDDTIAGFVARGRTAADGFLASLKGGSWRAGVTSFVSGFGRVVSGGFSSAASTAGSLFTSGLAKKLAVGVALAGTAALGVKTAKLFASGLQTGLSGLGSIVVSAVKGAFTGTAAIAATAMKGVGLAAVAGAAGAIGASFAGVNEASDIGESISKLEQILGDASAGVVAFTDTTATQFGIAKSSALEAAGQFATFANAADLTGPAATDFTNSLVALSGDFASFSNLNPEDVLLKFRAGLTGETEPLRDLGIFLTADAVGLKAVELGLASSATEATEAAKIQARYALIMEQSSKAVGDFGRTAGSVPNQVRALKAEVKDATAGLGEAIIPALGPAFDSVRAAVGPLFKSLEPVATALARIVSPIVDSLVPILPVLGTAIGTIVDLFGRLLGSLAPGVFEGIAGVFAGVTAALTPLLPVIETVGTVIGGLFAELGPVIGSVFEAFGRAAQILLPPLVAIFDRLSSDVMPVLLQALEPLADAFLDVADAVAPVVGDLGDALIEVLVAAVPMIGPLAESFVTLAEALLPIVPILGDGLMRVLVALAPVIPDLVDSFVILVDAALVPLVPVIALLVDWFADLVEFIARNKPLLYALVGIFLAIQAPVSLLTAAIIGLVAGVVLLYNKWGPFKALVDGIGRIIGNTVKQVGNLIGLFKDLFTGNLGAGEFGQGFGEIVDNIFGNTGKLVDVFRTVGDTIETVWNALVAGGKAVLPVIKAVWGVFKAVNIDPIVKTVKALAAVFTGDFGKAKEIFGSIFTGISDAVGNLGSKLSVFLATFADWVVGTAAPWIAEKSVELGGALLGWIGTAAPWIADKLGGLLSTIGSWIVGTAIPWLAAKGVELSAAFGQWILDLVVSLPGKLAGFITTVGGWIVGTAIPWLLQKGVELGGAFLGWVVDAALSLPGKLFNIIAAIGVWVTGTAIPWLINAGIQMGITFLGWILDAAIGLPLKLAQWIVKFGEWLVGTAVPWLVTKGLELAAAFGQWIFDFIVGLPGKLAGWITAIGNWVFGTAVPWVLQKGQDIAAAFGQWIVDTVTSLPGKLAGIASAIADFLASLPGRVADGAKSVGSAIWNGIVSGVTGAADAIGDIAQKLWNGLKGLINDKLIQPIRDFEVLGGHPFGDFPMLAEGAIVTKPTLAMVGEAGPELVLPLSDPARTAQLVSDAAAAGLLPATTPVTGTANPAVPAPPVAAVGAAGAATGPVLSTESVAAWSVEITEIMVALPTSVTEQTMPLWQEWVTLTTDLFTLWADGLLVRNRTLWAAFVADVNTGLFNAGQVMRTQLGAMNVGLGSALNTMVGTAASGAQRIGAALNAGLSNAVTVATGKVQGYGTKLAEAINPILAAIGQPPVVLQFATGGHVPGPRVNADVVPAMLTPGEYVLRRDVVDRVGTARLDALNEGRVQRFATGGSVLPADAVGRAQTFARQQAGEPYVWGSSGPDGYDCSGFWSAIINTIREPGRTPYRRLFNTASLIDGGWRNVGLLPGLGEVSVGAFKGNPGHMAGTIAGLNAESRGSAGVLVGPAARGAASPLFTNRYHMGNGLYLGENGTLYALPEPAAWGGGIIGSTGFKYEQFVHAKTKPWVTANTYTSNITAGMVATEPGVSLTGGWLPASSGKISEFGGPGDVNALAVTGGSTSAPPLGPYYAAMRWQTRNYSQLKNNRLKAVLPRTNRAVVMYPGDWGPAQWTGRVLDISPAAMSALGGRTDDIVQIVPVAANSRTGPVPVLHDGGVFTAPGGSREGLALLEHREEVVTRGDPRHVDNMPRGGSYTSRMDPGAVSELVAAMDRVATATVDRDSGLTVQVTAPETVSDPEHWGRLVGMRIRNARGRRR